MEAPGVPTVAFSKLPPPPWNGERGQSFVFGFRFSGFGFPVLGFRFWDPRRFAVFGSPGVAEHPALTQCELGTPPMFYCMSPAFIPCGRMDQELAGEVASRSALPVTGGKQWHRRVIGFWTLASGFLGLRTSCHSCAHDVRGSNQAHGNLVLGANRSDTVLWVLGSGCFA